MRRLVRGMLSYPVVGIAILIGIAGLVMLATPWAPAVPWIISAFTLVIAAREAWGMVRSLMQGNVGLDILAVTAIVATVVVGEYWASLVIVLMLSGGEALEDLAAGRARRELSGLLERVPVRAHRIVGGDETDVDDIGADEVAVGDELLVRPAEIIPVDGELLSESASLDESSLTGESLPVDRTRGQRLLSGSVNGSTAIRMRATAIASESQYQLIVDLVREASESKAPMVRLADRYALPFTLFAYAIAGVAWLLSGDPVRFAQVLVVATPCPLLIAAPVAFLAGMGRAAKNGIVVKEAGTLERMARARTVAFDKTGTLTHGLPDVLRVQPSAGFTETQLLELTASAEQYSSHVLAQSIMAEAQHRGLELLPAEEAGEVATNGVAATIGGRAVIVGKPRFIAEHTGAVDAVELEPGEAAVYIGIDDRFAGVIVLRDQVRAEAPRTLEALRLLEVPHTMMVTGDVAATAEHVAAEIGITDVAADCLPQDKVRIVHDAPHRPVVMVGDGVNDAPVLAAADVGVAMGARGSTAASESADVVILLDDLSKVARAVSISKRTVSIALESIWIGIALSVVLMVIAAFGVLPAIVGAGLQEVVDLVTILNALRALVPGRKDKAAVRRLERRSGESNLVATLV